MIVQPRVDVPNNLTEIILTGDGAIVRVQQRAENLWVGVVQRPGELDRPIRAATREELLRQSESEAGK